jgi:creatinine amidohydrolase
MGRARGLRGAHAGIVWYSNYPEHYAGDARPATREKGLALREMAVEDLARNIAAVKADTVVPGLNAEFFSRERAQRS